MNQYHIIKLAANSQLMVTKKWWVNSFICMDIYPKFRLPFNEWIKKLEDNRVLEPGRQFLKEKGLYDAMPAFCRCMLVEIFHSCASAVDNLYGNKPEWSHEPVWSKSNVRNLIIFFRLKDFIKARACYLAVKRYPLVLCKIEEEHAAKMAEHLKSV